MVVGSPGVAIGIFLGIESVNHPNRYHFLRNYIKIPSLPQSPPLGPVKLIFTVPPRRGVMSGSKTTYPQHLWITWRDRRDGLSPTAIDAKRVSSPLDALMDINDATRRKGAE